MARRRSLNRRSSRYSKSSSVVSAFLDPDSNNFEDDNPLWWKNLEDNNTLLHPSRRNASSIYDNSILDSNSNVGSAPVSKEWWKVLQSSSETYHIKRKLNVSKTEVTKDVQESSSSSDNETHTDIRNKKRRLCFTSRKSTGKNPFSQVLNDSNNTEVIKDVHKLSSSSNNETNTNIRNKKHRPSFTSRKSTGKNPFSEVLNDSHNTEVTKDVQESSSSSDNETHTDIRNKKGRLCFTSRKSTGKNPFSQVLNDSNNTEVTKHVHKLSSSSDNETNTDIRNKKHRLCVTSRKSTGKNPFSQVLNDSNNTEVTKDVQESSYNETNTDITNKKRQLCFTSRKSTGKNPFSQVLNDSNNTSVSGHSKEIATNCSVSSDKSNSTNNIVKRRPSIWKRKGPNQRSNIFSQVQEDGTTHHSSSMDTPLGTHSLNMQQNENLDKHKDETMASATNNIENTENKLSIINAKKLISDNNDQSNVPLRRRSDRIRSSNADKSLTNSSVNSVVLNDRNPNSLKDSASLLENDLLNTSVNNNACTIKHTRVYLKNLDSNVLKNINTSTSKLNKANTSTSHSDNISLRVSSTADRSTSQKAVSQDDSSKTIRKPNRSLRPRALFTSTPKRSLRTSISTQSAKYNEVSSSANKQYKSPQKDTDFSENLSKYRATSQTLSVTLIKPVDEDVRLDGQKHTYPDIAQLEESRLSKSMPTSINSSTKSLRMSSRNIVQQKESSTLSESISAIQNQNLDAMTNSRENNRSASLRSMRSRKILSDLEDSPGVSNRSIDNSIRAKVASRDKDQSKENFSTKKTNTTELPKTYIQRKIHDFFKGKQSSHTLTQPTVSVFSDVNKMAEVKRKMDNIKRRNLELLKVDFNSQSTSQKSQVQAENKKKHNTHKKVNNIRAKEIDSAYLVNGKIYKKPKLPRPKPWVTNRLYAYLWKCMEPKYKLSTRIRSEKFIKELADTVTFIVKQKTYDSYKDNLHRLMMLMAHLGIISTRHDFYLFCSEYLPYDFRVKATPICLPGNIQTIPYNPATLHTPLLTS